MNYYSIPPFEHLGADEECKHFLTVAQWVEQSEALFQFYKAKSLLGTNLILDNGVFEYREAYDTDKYIEMAKELRADIIVAPDEWKDANKTVNMTLEFINSLSDNDLRKFEVMAVPHGKTLEEYMWCYGKISREVGLIGLAKDEWGDSTGYIRPFMTHHLELPQVPMKFHLLGLTHVKELLYCNPDKVVSFDTSMPYKLGKEIKYLSSDTTIGTRYDPKAKLNDIQLEVSITNCNSLRELAGDLKQNLWMC